MSISADKELYTCNGCGDLIKKQRARITCNVCVDFNLCSNCYVINYFSKPHIKSHASTIIRESGQITCNKVKLNPSLRLEILENISVPLVEKQRKYSEIPTANWGALWNVMKAPLVKRDVASTKNLDKVEASDFQLARLRNNSTSPLSRSPGLILSQLVVEGQTQDVESPGPTYFCPDQWEPFFGDDNSPSSIFVALMSSIFNRLDEKRTGYLTPETYSEFLDMQGYPLQANIWKMAFAKAAGASSKDIADLELGLYFSQHSISHILIVRPAEPKKTKAYSKKLSNSAINEKMPLLLRQGFIDICAYDYLKDPSLAYQYLINVLQELKVWKELGDLPRSTLPTSPKIQNSPYQPEIEEMPLEIQEIMCEEVASLVSPKTGGEESVSLETLKTDYEEAVSLVSPKTGGEESVSLETPKTDYEEEVSLVSPKTAYEEAVSLETLKTDYEEEVSLETPKTGGEESVSLETPKTDYEEVVSLVSPKTAYEEAVSLVSPKTAYEEAVSLETPKTGGEESVSLETPKTDYEEAVSLVSPKTDYEESVSLTIPKIEYEDEFKPTFQSHQRNNQLKIAVVGEMEEKSKSAIFQKNIPDDELLSPKFTTELQEDLSPQYNIQTRRSFSKKTPRSSVLNSKLIVNTDFSRTWLSTASALSACDPQRRKVETIVEAYEHVRANSVCFDAMPTFRDSGLSGKSTL
ncbi:hypothetical protein GcC1_185029 [Golovinomyces cichoracearum]|uniref:ZZ-type domain-containing protein n=1 Tax=Golovinomyces cichoracearum TaxID=62708 RepID=A0A420HKU0_9PEZI|nr:hypothetical protein GcC1_185029 [Golovinomyces cichoracearum]